MQPSRVGALRHVQVRTSAVLCQAGTSFSVLLQEKGLETVVCMLALVRTHTHLPRVGVFY